MLLLTEMNAKVRVCEIRILLFLFTDIPSAETTTRDSEEERRIFCRVNYVCACVHGEIAQSAVRSYFDEMAYESRQSLYMWFSSQILFIFINSTWLPSLLLLRLRLLCRMNEFRYYNNFHWNFQTTDKHEHFLIFCFFPPPLSFVFTVQRKKHFASATQRGSQ